MLSPNPAEAELIARRMLGPQLIGLLLSQQNQLVGFGKDVILRAADFETGQENLLSVLQDINADQTELAYMRADYINSYATALQLMLNGNPEVENSLDVFNVNVPMVSEAQTLSNLHSELWDGQGRCEVVTTMDMVDAAAYTLGEQYLVLRKSEKEAAKAFIKQDGEFSRPDRIASYLQIFDAIVRPRLAELTGQQICSLVISTGIYLDILTKLPSEVSPGCEAEYYKNLKIYFNADCAGFIYRLQKAYIEACERRDGGRIKT